MESTMRMFMPTGLRVLAFLLAIGLGMLSLFIEPAHAGGIKIISRAFDGDPKKVSFEANKPIEMKFLCDGFRHAGKPYTYVIFELINLTKKVSAPYIFATFVPQFSDCQGRVKFLLPDPGIEYVLRYHVVPFFSMEPAPFADSGQFLPQNAIEQIKSYYTPSQGNYAGTEDFAQLISVSSGKSPPPSHLVTIYWKDQKQQIDDAIKKTTLLLLSGWLGMILLNWLRISRLNTG
jgi:hypothetical protein